MMQECVGLEGSRSYFWGKEFERCGRKGRKLESSVFFYSLILFDYQLMAYEALCNLVGCANIQLLFPQLIEIIDTRKLWDPR